MSNGRPVTNDKIYDLITSVRLELKSDIVGLRNDLTTLESGRLSRLESNFNDLKLQVQSISDSTNSAEKTLSGKFVAIGAVMMVMLSSFLSALFLWLFTRQK